MGASDVADVLVIGAGPAGLAVAACLKRREVAFDLVDRRGVAGGAYHHIYPGVTLASPARYAELPGLHLRWPREYITAPEYRAYLGRYAHHFDLVPRQAEVEAVHRQDHAFAVRFTGEPGPHTYRAVVAATGMFDFPVRADIPGLAQAGLEVLHAREWPGPGPFRGRRLLIVGGATGAVEIAEECARDGQRVAVSARSGVKISGQRFLGWDVHDWAYPVFDLLPRWAVGSYCDRRPTLPGEDLGFSHFRGEGLIEVRPGVVRFEGKTAVFPDGARQELDAVVLATGYRFATPFLPARVRRARAGHPLADGGQSRSWPGLFFIGYPCARGLSSEFLHGVGRDAPVVARRVEERLPS
jgi:putative flavoprotein involved in K+ transport